MVASRCVRPATRPDATGREERRSAELIGRNEEVAAFCELFASPDLQIGHIVSICGNAGVGKSRLVEAFRESVQRVRPEVVWLTGRSRTPTGTSYRPVLEMLGQYWGWQGDESAWERGRSLIAILRDFVRQEALSDKQYDEIAPLLGRLVGAEFRNEWDTRWNGIPARQIKQHTFEAVRTFFEMLAWQRPVVLVFEDFHWVDPLSFELVTHLMPSVASAPLFLICAYRPGYDRRSGNLTKLASMRAMGRFLPFELKELSPDESSRLIASLLGSSSVPAAVERPIVGRCGGNPLFIEEVVFSLVEAGALYEEEGTWVLAPGIESIHVPKTLQDVTAVRVDHLDAPAQRVIRRAAVIGPVFSYAVLERIVPDVDLETALAGLVGRGFIFEAEGFPDARFAFWHAVIRDAIYQAIPDYERTRLHREIADVIEDLYPHRGEEHHAELAHHYACAGSGTKAIQYLFQVAEQARRQDANASAARHYEQALGLIPKLPEGGIRRSLERTAHEAIADAYMRMSRHTEAEHHFDEALRLCPPGSVDRQRIAALKYKLADAIHRQGEYGRAAHVAEDGLAALNHETASPEGVNLLEVLCRAYRSQRDWHNARFSAERLREAVQQTPYFDSMFKAFYQLAYTEIDDGDVFDAISWLLQQEQICAESGNEEGLALSYQGVGDLYRHRMDDLRRAATYFEKSLKYAERVGETHLLLNAHFRLAHVLILLGESLHRVEHHLQQATQIADYVALTSNGTASLAQHYAEIASAFAETERTEQACQCMERAIESDPPTTSLPDMLMELEQLYALLGRHDDFAPFCARIQSKRALAGPLRFWYLRSASPLSDLPRTTWRDPFATPTLNECWCWEDPLGASSYELHPEAHEMLLHVVPVHDATAFRAPRLTREVESGFAAQVEIAQLDLERNLGGGLLMRWNDHEFVTFGKEPGPRAELRLHRWDGHGDVVIGRGWLPGGTLTLRIERTEHRVRALCTTDGATWYRVGEIRPELPNSVSIGVYGACGCMKNEGIVRLRDFRLCSPV